MAQDLVAAVRLVEPDPQVLEFEARHPQRQPGRSDQDE